MVTARVRKPESGFARFARIEFSLTKFDEPRLKAEGLDFVFEYIITINITK
jgi:hypothetical protein